jgi:hypothetical protein
MYKYPVLECLVAFAIVFLIGHLSAKDKYDDRAETPKLEGART